MSAVARQHVSTSIEADQSSFQPYRSECEQTVRLVSEGECRDNAPINTPQHSPT